MRIALSILLVLVLATTADATLTIVAPAEMSVGEVAEFGVDVVGESAALACALVTTGSSVLSVDSSQARIVELGIGEFVADLAGDPDMEAFLADLGITDVISALYFEVIHLAVPPMAIPDGALVDNVFMTKLADGIGRVYLVDVSGAQVLASAEVTVLIPEPAAISILGLGALFVRRRR